MSDSIISNTSYTSRDFNTIYPELLDLVKKLTYKWDPSISNESDPGVILIKLNALIADKCSYNIDKNVLECFPLSVTQESNARQIYEQLGYYMHWYESAKVPVTMSWTDTEVADTMTNDNYFLIPPFTTVCDYDNSIIYTLLGTSGDYIPTENNKVFFKGNSIQFDAIQGVPVQYDINGEKVITAANLDINHRLYFDTADIAENGIFITHTDGANDYSSWIKKDNLCVENLGNTFYKFGIINGTDTCYLEFPVDAETIFQNGIEITYIKTAAHDGIIPALYLEKFYTDLEADTNSSDLPVVTLSTDNVALTNYISSEGGLDKETIDEAYKGYQSIIGTYNTLITLRDYINAAIQSGLVSNAVVSDRNTDIQNSYKLMTSLNDVNTLSTVIEKTADDEPTLTAFDLKMYLLQYATTNIDTAQKYNLSFKLQTNKERDLMESYIKTQKSISHDFQDIVSPTDTYSHFCMFKNKYPIYARITPKYILTNNEIADLQNSVKTALYQKLNSTYMEFGATVDVDTIRNIILDADVRIADVYITSPEYETYAVYWNGITYKEISLNRDDTVLTDISGTSYITSITPVEGFALKQQTAEYDTDNTYNIDDVVKYSGELYISDEDNVTGAWDNTKWSPVADYDVSEMYALGEAVVYQDFAYRNIIATTGGPFDKNRWRKIDTNDINQHHWAIYRFRNNQGTWWVSYTPDGDYESTTWDDSYIKSHFFDWKGTIVSNDVFILEISPVQQFKDEIYVKSILAGTTPLLVEDTEFGYDISHNAPEISFETYDSSLTYNVGDVTTYNNVNYMCNTAILSGEAWNSAHWDVLTMPIRNIEKIRTNVDIIFTNTNNTYTLRDNEGMQFYAPNLIDGDTYSSYVKYDYNLVFSSLQGHVLPANTNYQLRTGEYIGFYWKEIDDDEALYNYYIYGEGNIICANFDLYSGTPIVDSGTGIAPTSNLYNERRINVSNVSTPRYIASSSKTGSMPSQYSSIIRDGLTKVLSSSLSISAKAINKVELDANKLSYWSLNTSDNDNFVLFEDASSIPSYTPSSTYQVGDIVAHADGEDVYFWECLVDSTTGAWDSTKWTLSHYSEYILQTGEYFYYTNNTLTEFNVLGTGTRIVRTGTQEVCTRWSVPATLTEDINMDGAKALTGLWFIMPTGANVSVQEQQYYNVGPGCTVKLDKVDGAIFTLTFRSDSVLSLDGYNISYATVSNPSIEDYIVLPQLNTSQADSGKWSGRSCLAINSSSTTKQYLLDNQTLILYTNAKNMVEILGKAYQGSSEPYYYPVAFEFNTEVATGGRSGDIYISGYDDDGNSVYRSIYIFADMSSSDTVKYSSYGGASIYFPENATAATPVELSFSVPVVSGDSVGYILPMYNPYTSDITSLTVELDGNPVSDFLGIRTQFRDSGTYYLKLDVTTPGIHTLSFKMINIEDDKKVITLNKLFKYEISKAIQESDKYNTYIKMMENIFDIDGQFKFTYQVPDENLIENPLDPVSFLNSHHIYNGYTICQLNVNDITLPVTLR